MRHMGSDKESDYRLGLEAAAEVGAAVLRGHGSAPQAVIAAVRSMEASGVFNAGAGSGLSRDGLVEVDAAVMVASDSSIGAVAAVPSVENAVDLAEAVRVHSPHVMLAGEGAARFAESQQVEVVPCFPDEGKLSRYRKMIDTTTTELKAIKDQDLARFGGTHDEGDTVGAVAIDAHGEIACASSTGGLWLKAPGRVGDTPLAGPGFWCERNLGVAIATGVGEFIIRGQVCARTVDYLRESSAEAAAGRAIAQVAARFGPGKVGVVSLKADGDVGFVFDTAGMGHALIRDGWPKPRVAVWPTETL